jgi:uncharacterized protein
LTLGLAILTLLALPLATPAQADSPTFPKRPDGVSSFYVDEAGLISPSAGSRINAISKTLLADKQAPIIVVTITSMSDHGASAYSIERYATELFNSWGIGTQPENLGILLLVSRDDRRARIELGAGWGRFYDAGAQSIMDSQIIPPFKAGLFSDGILAGVQALDRMARGTSPASGTTPIYSPTPGGGGMSFTAIIVIAGSAVFGLAMIISLFRSGTDGWGWSALKVMGSIMVFLFLASLFVVRVAAFAGGVAGGGGATGSW